ncbi:MAG: hypothetical protein M1837_001670 [Sclerophora amabilis]|nr:MAG: hypothetical protein M1837_001670 [Sclerophora amabilis]
MEREEDGSILYTINFTQPFNTSQNATEILRPMEKTAGAANNVAPNYFDGMMFANDHEFFLYGGLLRDTESIRPPPATSVFGYERFQYGPVRESWEPGFLNAQLPDDGSLTRYVTSGAGVNVPSEDLGFYFSGLRREDWGDIRNLGRSSYNATTIATSLISVDMFTMRSENWANDSLPSEIAGRAGAELAWIPTNSRGVLIAIGGVINPEWAYTSQSDQNTVESQNTSPGFMETVSIYDITSKEWYTQETSGDTPPQLARFCSVVASAEDKSSHNIYIYGGHDGYDEFAPPSDDVYILSIPSFIWIKAVNGTSAHGRRSHKCAKVYPDQMLVVGGAPQTVDEFICLDGGMVQIFNLNTLQWQDKYDPEEWSEYKVPKIVTDKIGGNADGGATTSTPSLWSDGNLSTIFRVRYRKTIPKYYPYSSVQPTSTNTPLPTRISTSVPTQVPPSGGVPSYVAPVLGVVLGLVVLTAILACVLLYRRRKYAKRWAGNSVDGTSAMQQARVWDWISGNPPPNVAAGKDETVASSTEERSGASAATAVDGTETDQLSEPNHIMSPELGTDSEIHELQGTPATYELATKQTGMTPAPTGYRHGSRPPLSASSSGSSTEAGASIDRPDSPTTSLFIPGHHRQVSSLDATDVQRPSSWEREGAITPPSGDPAQTADPMEGVSYASPVSPSGEKEGTLGVVREAEEPSPHNSSGNWTESDSRPNR